MKEKKLIQCLFDFKDFFSKKGHKYFPGRICFPQYFAFAIHSIFKNLYIAFEKKNVDEINLCTGYFDILPMIIEQVYDRKDIKVDKNKLKKMSNQIETKKIPLDDDYFLLETYLQDEESVKNYRKALLESVLNYHKYKTVNEFINHLNFVECCTTKEKDIPIIPPSEHYLLINFKRDNNIDETKINILKNSGTKLWGPFYWNIFHSMSETARCENKNDLIKYIYILPFTLPCRECTSNYISNWSYFLKLIQECETSQEKCIKTLYTKIHDKINYETISF